MRVLIGRTFEEQVKGWVNLTQRREERLGKYEVDCESLNTQSYGVEETMK